MPRQTCSTTVLTALLSLWMLDGGPIQTIRAQEPEPPAPPYLAKIQALLKDKIAQPAEGDDEEKKLLKARYAVAVTMMQFNLVAYERGIRPLPALLEGLEKLREARLELSDKPKDQVAILELCFEMAKICKETAEAMHKAGRYGPDTVAAARYARLTAELRLLRVKRKLKDAGSK